MSNITRWNPTREIAAMQETLDRFFDGVWNTSGMMNRGNNTLALDLHENDNAYVLTTNLPGVDADDIDVTVHDNVLTISAEVNEDSREENDNVLVRERSYGRFSRRLTLPRGIDVDNIDSELNNGVLTLTLPKTEIAQRRRIEVRKPNLVEGSSN
jgi:HSP20 family protein